MPRGGARPGAGRKKGVTRALKIIQQMARAAQMTPLEYMLTVMRDPDAPQSRRDAMAIAAAPYVHPKYAVVAYRGANSENDNDIQTISTIERQPIAIEAKDITEDVDIEQQPRPDAAD